MMRTAAASAQPWLVMEDKVKVSPSKVSFNTTWVSYREDFGIATLTDNYWIGNDLLHSLDVNGIMFPACWGESRLNDVLISFASVVLNYENATPRQSHNRFISYFGVRDKVPELANSAKFDFNLINGSNPMWWYVLG